MGHFAIGFEGIGGENGFFHTRKGYDEESFIPEIIHPPKTDYEKDRYLPGFMVFFYLFILVRGTEFKNFPLKHP
jgi:hypothetical protein